MPQEWQREILAYFSGKVPLETLSVVSPYFLLPLPQPEDPVLPGVGGRFRKTLLIIVTCTILCSNKIPRNQDRSFKNKLEKSAFRGSCWGIKT